MAYSDTHKVKYIKAYHSNPSWLLGHTYLIFCVSDKIKLETDPDGRHENYILNEKQNQSNSAPEHATEK